PAQSDSFQPQDGSAVRRRAARTFPEGISLDLASPLTAGDPVAIEALPDCTVLILDRNPGRPFSLIRRYRYGRLLGEPVSVGAMSNLIAAEDQAAFRLTGFDMAFVPEHLSAEGNVPDRLYVVAESGNQSFAFNLSQQDDQLQIQPLPSYLPMRR